MTWSSRFDAPIPLPDGRKLVTLRQAGEYIASLPEAEQNQLHWRSATSCLLMAAERGGIVMMADIAMRRALGFGRERTEPEPRKKRVRVYRVIGSVA